MRILDGDYLPCLKCRKCKKDPVQCEDFCRWFEGMSIVVPNDAITEKTTVDLAVMKEWFNEAEKELGRYA